MSSKQDPPRRRNDKAKAAKKLARWRAEQAEGGKAAAKPRPKAPAKG